MSEMTPGELAALDRVLAAWVDLEVAKGRLDIEAENAARTLRNFGDAWYLSMVVEDFANAEEVAAHPDLAELNVMMDGFYSA